MRLSSIEIASLFDSQWIFNDKFLPPDFFDSENISTDSRKIPPKSLFIPLKGEKYDGHDFIHDAIHNGASAVLISKDKSNLSKNINIPFLIVDDTETALRKIAELNRKKSSAKVIAITGTCGKTSTKEFIQKIFSDFFGSYCVIATTGNTNNLIGVPQNLLRLNHKHKVAVIEIGTNKFGEIKTLSLCAKPDIAIITSIGRGHTEFLKNTEGVAKEKSSIFKALKENGVAIIPYYCDFRNILLSEAKKHSAKILSFSCNPNADCEIRAKLIQSTISESKIEVYLQNHEKKVFSLPVPGIHQASNALIAILCAAELGIPLNSALKSLESANLCGMRMRQRTINEILFINDAYNSNPESAAAALKWLAEVFTEKEKLFIFIGDMLELGNQTLQMHQEILSLALSLFPNSKIITVGQLMKQAASTLGKNHITSFNSSDEAAIFAKSELRKGHTAFLKGSRGIAMEKIEKIFECPD